MYTIVPTTRIVIIILIDIVRIVHKCGTRINKVQDIYIFLCE